MTPAFRPLMRFAYVYFMKPEPDRVRAAAPRHAGYWQGLALDRYRGGPFADRSGGLIVFEGESRQHAERLVVGDPFLRERLLARHWIKEWVVDADPRTQIVGRPAPSQAREGGTP
jgi:hypothetical protein